MKAHFFPRYFLLLLSLFFLLSACGQANSTVAPTETAAVVKDAYGKPIEFPKTPPQRIVTLVPNMSEILGALHLESRVVGVDYYTDYPATLATRPKVSNASGTYNIEQIMALKPDLILSWGGETKPIDPQLTNLGLHVVDFPKSDFSQTLTQIVQVGRLTGVEQTAQALVDQLDQQITQIKTAVAGTASPPILLEVDDSTPGKPFVFGGGSFGDELAQDAHAQNIFHSNMSNGGYPQVSEEAVLSANPQFIILTEDPQYGGSTATVYQRPNWQNLSALKMKHVYHIAVDLMQRPGPRLVQGLRCLAQIVHPDKFLGALPAYCS